jgi:hypothetical protein
VRDGAGNLVTSASTAITAAITSGSGTLLGTTTVNAVGGIATFTSLRIDGAGSHQLTFTGGALTAAGSTSFTVTQNVASIAVTTQPSGAVNGSPFSTQPVITVRDNAGLTVQGNATAITAAVASGSGTLAGTAVASAVNGVATFTNLQINGTGAHTLVFSA